jgi:hypothetical protein
MGQIKDGAFMCKRRDGKRRDKAPPIRKEPSKMSTKQQEKSKARYSYDGFWTTKLPAATAFSFEWFKTHSVVIPYCWSMLKMALSVSKWDVFVIMFGTIARAVVDAAQLYAYTRFVTEVRS